MSGARRHIVGRWFVTAVRGQVSLLFMVTPPTIQVASIGMADSLILMVLALVVFGPRRLPQIGRQIGKLMYEFRKASNDFKFQMEEELRNAEDADRRKKEEEERQKALLLAPPATATEGEAAAQSQDAAYEASADPYGGGSTYPYPTQYETPAPETRPLESDPRIAPPSTGETVAANPPGSVTVEAPAAEASLFDPPAQAQPAAAEEPAAKPAVKRVRRKKKEAAVEPTSQVTEPASENG